MIPMEVRERVSPFPNEKLNEFSYAPAFVLGGILLSYERAYVTIRAPQVSSARFRAARTLFGGPSIPTAISWVGLEPLNQTILLPIGELEFWVPSTFQGRA